jgi:NADH dehydrogenase [ubiquinone] 1 alpha subcomplex assembly factor 5
MSAPTDAPSLLNRAGFTTTTVDVEDMTIAYPSIWELMHDLRDMGESNAILGRRAMISRDVLLAAEGIYKGERASEPVGGSARCLVSSA